MQRILFYFLFIPFYSFAQQPADSSKTLSEVIIRAFEQNRKLQQVPAPVTFISETQLTRFSNTNILPALNSTPGVKMEERSPGSFRLNIRGSSLRSPFGVRNVKIYFNDIPYTDPGGNSYLNQIGFYNFQTIEVLRGPGSSLYGSGTGGVLLIRSEPLVWKPGLSIDHTAGSFGLQNFNVALKAGNDRSHHSINYQHHIADGYRDHSELRRDVVAWHSRTNWKTGSFHTHVMLGDLFYETPGALTLVEYKANPKASRPAVGGNPSAEASKAAIFQKMAWGGIVVEQNVGHGWKNITSLYGVYSQLKNPTFRNYGYATEPHTGGRTVFSYKTVAGRSALNWVNGAEFQKSFTDFKSYSNVNGNAGNPISTDKINNTQYFIFSQLDIEFSNNWIVTGGLSLNKLRVRIRRSFPGVPEVFERTYSGEMASRIALLKRIGNNLSVYGSVARGFSPPTIAEVLPSSNIINTALEAESGYNFELGMKGSLHRNKLYYDINAFYFSLKNTIVQRRDASGADFFINAGSTTQKGIETYLSYSLAATNNGFINSARINLSYTWHHFRYKDFKQLTNDFSGKDVPSVAPHVAVLSMDLASKRFYLNLTYSYNAKIPLNDANSEYADAYQLVDGRLGYRLLIHNEHNLSIYAGINNALDEQYSLGNDINGFGGRYYNAAAGRNFFGGISYRMGK